VGVRVGVDVGGTFTKAVAFDLAADARAAGSGPGRIVAQRVVPTTHADPHGVAAGVVEVVAGIAEAVGAGAVELVVHSTTQAVNALLEGDTAPVGVIGLGRRPDLARARRRTGLRRVALAPGRWLHTLPLFLDVTDGLDEPAVRAGLADLAARGARTVCVAEAFAPDDARHEARVAALAAEEGMPACTSAELSGLYGLELRAVTAALNASVLPIAAATAAYVEQGLDAAGVRAPLMIMRGDGGATDMDGFRRTPARTLYSGPAASVAGALRYSGTRDAVVVEIGGTSTNVAGIRGHRPSLSYVQVASHATAVRAVDVRVIGVAGGSMLRVRRGKVYGVGPRSAHIAGLRYAAYAPADAFAGDARAVGFAPAPGDPADYLAVETGDPGTGGERFALTNTCAAVALGVVQPGDYAWADPAAALAAFAVAGRHLRLDGPEVARRMLEASGTAVCELVEAVAADHRIPMPPSLVAVGGGAGGLGRHVAAMLGATCTVPSGAEVISSVGDALSLLRAERERTVEGSSAALLDALVAEVEAEVVAAGAAPASVEVRVDEQPEKGTVRAVATGAVALASGARPGRDAIDADTAARRLGGAAVAVGAFWVGEGDAAGAPGRAGPVTALDRWGDLVVETVGEMLVEPGGDAVAAAVARRVRHRGPVTVEPTVWVLHGNRVDEIDSGARAGTAADIVNRAAAAAGPGRASSVVIVGSR
jgi:N-methylhydantoinase A/oxoprolinase/acetone carboxylase beta subunit